MVRTKVTGRRISQIQPVPEVIGNKNILNTRIRNAPYKMKKALPQSRMMELMQNGRFVRRMNVRRKSYYLVRRKSYYLSGH